MQLPVLRPSAATLEPGVVEQVDTRTRLGRPWKVIVHDDPITLMVYVTRVFQEVFGYSREKAHQLMMQVHVEGRSIVWTGPREQAELYVSKLHGRQLLATLEPTQE